MFFSLKFVLKPQRLVLSCYSSWIFLATNACLLFTQTFEGIYPVWKQNSMLIFIGIVLTPRLMIDESWHFVLGSRMNPQDDSLREWCCWICDFGRGFNSGTKDGLCHSELWVDFIKATGIKKASNNRGQESTTPLPVFARHLILISKLLIIDKHLKADRVAPGAALSHNIHICTKGVLCGWDTLYKSWRKTDF